MPKTIFITGVAGFLGSYIADEMLSKGHKVIGCDNLIGGFKAFKKKLLPVEQLKENSWMDFELLINASRNKMKIKEVPIHYINNKK